MDWVGAASAQQNFHWMSWEREFSVPQERPKASPVWCEVLHTCLCSNSEALSWIRQNWKINKRVYLSKSAWYQAQKLLYSLAPLEMPKCVLQDSKIVMEFKVMKSLSPWNKACRFLNSTETFPSSKTSTQLGLPEEKVSSVLFPSELTVECITVLFVSLYVPVEWVEGLARRFRLHLLLHPKHFEIICQWALHSLNSSKQGPLVLEKTKTRRHNCGVVVTAQNWSGEKALFCS